MLKQLATRLKASLRGSDELIRFGGDEFGVVLMDADAEYATTIAQHLTESLEEPFVVESVSSQISASIGIAHASADAADGAALMACADVAMYRAKSSGVPFAVFADDRTLTVATASAWRRSCGARSSARSSCSTTSRSSTFGVMRC